MLDDIRVAWVAWAILIACMIAPWLPKKATPKFWQHKEVKP